MQYLNRSNAEASFIYCFQMSTHVSGFKSFFIIFASFCIGQITHQQHKG